MRTALSRVVVATLHLAMPLLVAAQADASTPPPPEIRINPQSAAAATSAGISAETLDAVAKAIQAYGVTWDRGDEKQHRETITGAPALIDMAVASLHAEQAENAASQLAREKLPGRPVQPGTTQPSKREPYPRTEYHSRVLAENVAIKGDTSA